MSDPSFGTSSYPSYSGSGNPLTETSYQRGISRPKPLSNSISQSASDDETPSLGGFPAFGLFSTDRKTKRSRSRTGSSDDLPMYRRRQSTGHSRCIWETLRYINYRPRSRRSRLFCFLLLLAMSALGVFVFVHKYEIQVEFSVFSRDWVRSEINDIQPLKGCFERHNISPHYNLSQHYAGRRQMISPGISLRRGMSCYDYASTIQRVPHVPLSNVLYHSYWRSDLIQFGDRQAAALTAFLATQPLGHSKFILWSNGADILARNEHLAPFLSEWADHIEVRQVVMADLTRGTEVEQLLSAIGGGGDIFDKRAWVDGDAIRLLALWHYGGVWLDMDQVLTRDIHPLLESEFVTQWDCYDKPYFALNGALMHFHKHSPYLCEAFHIMASNPLPDPNTFTWGSHLYSKLHRNLVASHVTPFAVLPWCFSDPRNCRADIRFPDPFEQDPAVWGGLRWDNHEDSNRSGRELLEDKVGFVWSIHLHNQWAKKFPRGGWVDRLVEGYKDEVARLKQLQERKQGL